MEYINECRHPEQNYLFSMDIEGEYCDVWVVQKPSEPFYKGYLEFCLRYGNRDHEYRSSWSCSSIERGISFHHKFSDDDAESAKNRDQCIELKTRLKEAGYWDIDWDLDVEIKELVSAVDSYIDSYNVVVIG
jgi:hypothetical protein